MRKHKPLTSHSRWRCRRKLLCSTHHHGPRRTSTTLNNTHCTTLLLNILARVFLALWYSDGVQEANIGVQEAIAFSNELSPILYYKAFTFVLQCTFIPKSVSIFYSKSKLSLGPIFRPSCLALEET